MYEIEKRTKNSIEYTIGKGKTGTWKGTGVKGCVYKISIQNKVSFPYTCQPNNAQINQINNIKNNEIAIQSMKLSNFSFLIFIVINRTEKNHIRAQAKEKL